MSLTFFELPTPVGSYANTLKHFIFNDLWPSDLSDKSRAALQKEKERLTIWHIKAFSSLSYLNAFALIRQARRFQEELNNRTSEQESEIKLIYGSNDFKLLALLNEMNLSKSDRDLLLDLGGNSCWVFAVYWNENTNWFFGPEDSAARMTPGIIWDYATRKCYFKIYPDYVEMFRKTRLDVPFDCFVPPYPMFDILLAKDHPIKTKNLSFFGVRVGFLTKATSNTNGMIWQGEGTLGSNFVINLCIFTDLVSKIRDREEIYQGLSPEQIAMMAPFVVDIGMTENMNFQTVEQLVEYASAQLLSSFESAHLEVENKAGRLSTEELKELVRESNKVVADFLRVILSVSFLHRGFDADLLEPDFLNKDLQPYLDAIQKKDEKKVQAIREKADRERGKKGVAIGKSDYLLGKRYIVRDVKEDECVDENQEKPESSRELKYCHLRNPHFRMMRVGKGRTEFRSKFIRQVIVRKDLPPKPNSGQVGFSTPKEKK